ncbi:hypothetical protein LZ30DRAFT_724351 [Colletotrichum cereale]|nr:hypothetical protein LZ30DRAFT_724351 [Colletotrichum cereale]
MPISSQDPDLKLLRIADTVILPVPNRVKGPYERGSKAPKVLWSCCNCGQSSIAINTDPCPFCSSPRCAYCPLTKIKRQVGRRHLPGMEQEQH